MEDGRAPREYAVTAGYLETERAWLGCFVRRPRIDLRAISSDARNAPSRRISRSRVSRESVKSRKKKHVSVVRYDVRPFSGANLAASRVSSPTDLYNVSLLSSSMILGGTVERSCLTSILLKGATGLINIFRSSNFQMFQYLHFAKILNERPGFS